VNDDGDISEPEADAYGRRVLGALVLSVDDRPVPLTLRSRRFPAFDQMRAGIGTIRLSAKAAVSSAVGPHRVAYVNRFCPELSAYLANALVPSNDRIEITAQQRDWLQRRLTIDYRVGGNRAQLLGWSFAAFAMTGLLGIARRPRWPR
jgi:hypothetical protein